MLRVVGEQHAVTLPQLARMMGCSSHAARWLRSRWERAGWARGRDLLVGQPVYVWLTRRGQSLAAAGVPMRTLQEGMGHRDYKTTLIYADYAPIAHERELVEKAFGAAGATIGDNRDRRTPR